MHGIESLNSLCQFDKHHDDDGFMIGFTFVASAAMAVVIPCRIFVLFLLRSVPSRNFTRRNVQPPSCQQSHSDDDQTRERPDADAMLTSVSTTRAEFVINAITTLMAASSLPSGASASEPTPKLKRETSLSGALEESLSGLVAGSTLTLTKSLVKYPLDTATVRLQMPNSEYSILRPLQLLDGAYRGIWVPLLTNVPAGAVFFSVKDATLQVLRHSPAAHVPSWLQTSLAVGLAQVPYWLVRNPSEVVKTRQQAGLPGFGDGVTVWEAYRKVRDDTIAAQAASATKSGSVDNSTKSGLAGFYVGYWENILYAYPADVIKFVCYDWFSGGRTRKLSPAEGALAGAVSTAVAQLLTTPLDVVRNRVMAQQQQQEQGPSQGSGDDQPLSGLSLYLDTLVRLGREEGLNGLLAGATPRVGKALVSGAIQFATYEETKQAVGNILRKQR